MSAILTALTAGAEYRITETAPSLITNGDFSTALTNGWTEVDSGSNVGIVSNQLQITGNGSLDVNGVYSDAVDMDADGFFVEAEIEIDSAAINARGYFGLAFDADLDFNDGAFIRLEGGSIQKVHENGSNVSTFLDSSGDAREYTADTAYTFRFYRLDHVGTWLVTAEGGTEYTSETALGAISTDFIVGTPDTSTMYVVAQVEGSGVTMTVDNVKTGTTTATLTSSLDLSDEITSRFSNEDLVRLSNPGNRSASSIDTTRLNLAATDVQAMVEIYSNITYDNTDTRHRAVAVQGVTMLLRRYQANTDVSLEDIKDLLRDLAKITGRDRIMPTSNSVKTRNDDPDKKFDYDINTDFDSVIPDKEA